VIDKLHNMVKDVILVHFDADLGISTKEALTCIEPYIANRKKPIYLLFDDWGCHPDEVPDAFYAWVEENKKKNKFNLQKVSSTRYTRYYKINFI
jgi:hypothetical protein